MKDCVQFQFFFGISDALGYGAIDIARKFTGNFSMSSAVLMYFFTTTIFTSRAALYQVRQAYGCYTVLRNLRRARSLANQPSFRRPTIFFSSLHDVQWAECFLIQIAYPASLHRQRVIVRADRNVVISSTVSVIHGRYYGRKTFPLYQQ